MKNERTSSGRSGLALSISGFVVLSIAANGYVFGVDDHGIHLAFQDMVLHRGHWDGDLLREAFRHHHSWFWHLQAPFALLLGLPAWAATLHVATLAATGLALWHLSTTLWESEEAAALVLLLLAPAHGALGGADTLDPLLLNRGVALPLELLAFWLLLRDRAPGAFVVLGMAAWIHAPSAAAAAAALVAANTLLAVFERDRRGLLAPLGFCVGALPVALRWLFAGDVGEGLGLVDAQWWAVVEARLAHHVLPSSWPLSDWLTFGAWMALAGVGLAKVRPEGRGGLLLIGAFVGLASWVAIVGAGLGSVGHVALALQLEPWQATRFAVLLAAIAVSGWLVEADPVALPGRVGRSALVLLFVIGAPLLALPLLVLVAAAERRGILAVERWQLPLLGGWLTLLLGATLLGGFAGVFAWAEIEAFGGLVAGRMGPPRIGWFVSGGAAVGVAALGIAAAELATRRSEETEDFDLLTALRQPLSVAFPLVLVIVFVSARVPPGGDDAARLLPRGETTEESLLAEWLADNLPYQARLAVPPHAFASERWRADRPFVVTWKDGGEALFARAVALEWKTRLEAACDCKPLEEALPLDAEPGVRLRILRDRIEEGLHKASPETEAKAARAAGATHLVLWSFEPASVLEGREPLRRTESYHVYELGP